MSEHGPVSEHEPVSEHGPVPDVADLGRSVVVDPGQPAPEQWADCDRVAVSAVDAGTARDLHEAWRRRRPLVIELSPGAGLDDPSVAPPERVESLQPWEWPVDLYLPGEALHHAVWANSVDARPGGVPPAWRWGQLARRLGAGPGGQGGDVVLPDGRPAICDGGPLDAGLAGRVGLPVVHRIALEHGSLDPLGPPHPPAGLLAADQMAAVGELGAGARVIAPAGSGKTRVLTERARLMIRSWGLPAGALALVAYNVRAASEMRDRLSDVPQLRIRTLNALGLRLCGRSRTLEEIEVRRILSDLVSFPRRAETDPAAPWIEALGRVRLGLADPVVVEDEMADVSDLDRVARAYRAELAGREAVDFDEQITGAIERLLSDPAFRARSQRYARLLLIDEFQDLTPAHMLLIRLLSGPAGSVFAVGDDDQTIYGYAGATPRWLVDFERWFPGSASHALEVNYRCPPEVVSAAANLLTRNTVRVPKDIRAADPPFGDAVAASPEGPGRPAGLRLVRAGEGGSGTRSAGPAAATASTVVDLLAAGAAPSDIAVLSRVNATLVPVRVLLGHRGVPVNSSGEARFLQRGGVRGAIAWLEVATAAGPLPGAALREAARRPKRGMSNSLLDLLGRPRGLDSLQGLPEWLEAKGSARDADKVGQFVSDVALVRRAALRGDTATVLGVIRSQVGGGGLDASASALDQWSHGAIAAHLDDLDALGELAELEPDPARFPAWLADRLAEPVDPSGVTLASVHAVKGREWPWVVLHHATDGLMPHRLSEDGEEERRVFHVGLTRASRGAVVVAGTPPSPFLDELDRPIQPGEAVERAAAAASDGRTRGGDRARATGSPAGRAASGSPGGAGRKPAGAGGARSGREATAELLPAGPGTSFQAGGHDHEVVEVATDAAVTLIGGGPARTRTRFGTLVTSAGAPALLAHPAAERAWERLREWRTGRARAQSVPPYVVFDDRTLRMVAATLPVTEAGLLAISGIGPVKSETYGAEVMAIAEELREAAGTAGTARAAGAGHPPRLPGNSG